MSTFSDYSAAIIIGGVIIAISVILVCIISGCAYGVYRQKKRKRQIREGQAAAVQQQTSTFEPRTYTF